MQRKVFDIVTFDNVIEAKLRNGLSEMQHKQLRTCEGYHTNSAQHILLQ